eukprot:s1502_g10.t1
MMTGEEFSGNRKSNPTAASVVLTACCLSRPWCRLLFIVFLTQGLLVMAGLAFLAEVLEAQEKRLEKGREKVEKPPSVEDSAWIDACLDKAIALADGMEGPWHDEGRELTTNLFNRSRKCDIGVHVAMSTSNHPPAEALRSPRLRQSPRFVSLEVHASEADVQVPSEGPEGCRLASRPELIDVTAGVATRIPYIAAALADEWRQSKSDVLGDHIPRVQATGAESQRSGLSWPDDMVVYRPIASATANRPAAFSRPVIGKASQPRPAYSLPRSFSPILRKTSAPAKDSQVLATAELEEDPVDEFQAQDEPDDAVLDEFENAEANDIDALDALDDAAPELSEDAEGNVADRLGINLVAQKAQIRTMAEQALVMLTAVWESDPRPDGRGRCLFTELHWQDELSITRRWRGEWEPLRECLRKDAGNYGEPSGIIAYDAAEVSALSGAAESTYSGLSNWLSCRSGVVCHDARLLVHKDTCNYNRVLEHESGTYSGLSNWLSCRSGVVCHDARLLVHKDTCNYNRVLEHESGDMESLYGGAEVEASSSGSKTTVMQDNGNSAIAFASPLMCYYGWNPLLFSDGSLLMGESCLYTKAATGRPALTSTIGMLRADGLIDSGWGHGGAGVAFDPGGCIPQ